MSEEQLKAFIAKVQGDLSLQEKLNAEAADLINIAKEEGFLITEEDLKNPNNKLSDQELEAVAGGTGTAMTCQYSCMANTCRIIKTKCC